MGAYVPTGGGSSSGPTTTPADNLANPAAIPSAASFGLLWDPVGAQWVRARTAATGDGVNPNTAAAAAMYAVGSGSILNRLRDATAVNPDGSSLSTSPGILVAQGILFDGINGNLYKQRNCGTTAPLASSASAMQFPSTATEATAAANTAVTTTYAAGGGGVKHTLTLLGISWSGAAATTGLLTVQDGATTILSVDVPLTLNAPFFVPLPPGGLGGTTNTAMTITLAAGGAGAIGKLNTAKLTG